MTGRALFLITLLIIIPINTFADINTVMDKIYQQNEAPLLESAWLVFTGAELLNETSDFTEVQNYIDDKGWKEKSLTQGQLAVLLAEHYDIPSGLMYRLTKAPRYALKDMVTLNIITGAINKDKPVTGYELITALSLVLEGSEE